MSDRVRPPMEEQLGEAIDAFGNRVRVQILGALRENGPSTRSEVAAAVGAGHPNTVFHHLRALVALGVVETDPPESEWVSGQRVHYRIITSKVDALYSKLGSALGIPL